MSRRAPAGAAAVLAAAVGAASGPQGAWTAVQEAQRRDAAAGRTLVAHVVVALADNAHQGIVPVPAALGDGADAAGNLYWGARYGLRTFLARSPHWELVGTVPPPDGRILQRVVFRLRDPGAWAPAGVVLIGDAWRGDAIRGAVERFLEMASGRHVESVTLPGALAGRSLDAGGGADVVVYAGHNGLMDFFLPEETAAAGVPCRRGAIVLACASRQSFTRRLEARGAVPLLLTGGLVAAEAYTLDAALRAWFSGASPPALHDAAARAYDRYQKCGVGAAKRLFTAGP